MTKHKNKINQLSKKYPEREKNEAHNFRRILLGDYCSYKRT
jgi:hypothetical protein